MKNGICPCDPQELWSFFKKLIFWKKSIMIKVRIELRLEYLNLKSYTKMKPNPNLSGENVRIITLKFGYPKYEPKFDPLSNYSNLPYLSYHMLTQDLV